MARPAMLVLLTALVGLSPVACTFLSGVEGMEVRRGGGAEGGGDDATGSEVGPADDAAPLRTDASSSGAVDATVPTGSDAACATAAECQEQRCRNDAFSTDRIEAEIGKVLAVTATCTPGTPYVVSPGPSHYYAVNLRCTLAPQPTPAALSSFQTKMNADGWYGYTTQSAGADTVVVGMSTTRLCNTY